MEGYGIITADRCPIYGSPPPDGEICGEPEMTDEVLSGWLVRTRPILERQGREWLYATTHYGYGGYIRAANVRLLPSRENDRAIPKRKSPAYRRVNRAFADILCRPNVRAAAVQTLCRDSLVRVLGERESEEDTDGDWTAVRCADGRAGYIRTAWLSPRLDDDEYFLRGNLLWQRGLKMPDGEKKFRRRLTECAMNFLGTQYRWGGKSSGGVDCSGFVFLCYMENGVLIYRDALIKPGYPVHEISRGSLKPGDLIYWRGHVAMYLGRDSYIHAAASPPACVTVNSLNPEAEGYREDLAGTVEAFGSIF